MDCASCVSRFLPAILMPMALLRSAGSSRLSRWSPYGVICRNMHRAGKNLRWLYNVWALQQLDFFWHPSMSSGPDAVTIKTLIVFKLKVWGQTIITISQVLGAIDCMTVLLKVRYPGTS